jgi:predicted PurR-regulated permease PerM
MTRLSTRWQKALILPLILLSWLVVLILVVWLLGFVVKTVLTLVFAGIVAFALAPLVGFFSRWMRRSFAVALAYLIGVALFLGLGTLIVVSATGQITTLSHDLPAHVTRLEQLEPRLIHYLKPFGVTAESIHQARTQASASLQGMATGLAASSLTLVEATVGTIIDIVIVLILSVYLLANGHRISVLLHRAMPQSRRWHATLVIGITNRVVGGYIRGTLTLAALIGVLVGGGMFLLGVPYALLLGLLAFFMEFIPIVGVFISGALAVLLALTQGWQLALLVLAYFVFVHVIEGELIGPRIMGNAIGIHPGVALVALVAGTELFGIWGALLGAPIAGLIQAIGTAIWQEARGGRPEEIVKHVAEQVELEAGAGTGAAHGPGSGGAG